MACVVWHELYRAHRRHEDSCERTGFGRLAFAREHPEPQILHQDEVLGHWSQRHATGHITDISPLADCKHLEFLEIFTNDITDLTPLSGLTELRHLNASNNPNLSDISPVYELHGLERFWCGHYNSVPQEQFDRFCELNPNCQVNFTCFDPHEDWRWGTERYALLQEQLGYLTYDYQIPENDPLYEPGE